MERVNATFAAGELVFHLFGAIAHFERRLISQRTKDGLLRPPNSLYLDVADPHEWCRWTVRHRINGGQATIFECLLTQRFSVR